MNAPAPRAGGLLLVLVLLGSQVPAGRAESRMTRGVREALLRNDSVRVIVRWKSERRFAAQALGEVPRVALPLIGATALSANRRTIEDLVSSGSVDAVHLDPEIQRGEPEEIEDLLPLEAPPEDPGETWGLQRLRIPQVWKEFGLTGKGVRVGLVDTGIDRDAAGIRVRSWVDLTPARDPEPVDDDGHGTHVAGTIAASRLVDGVRVGVAPGVELLVARAIGVQEGRLSQVMSAMMWLADPDGDPSTPDGAQIIHCSFGLPAGEEEPLWEDFFRALDARNITVVVAAGNEGRQGPGSVLSPGTLSTAITVGAIDPDELRASFSSYGWESLGRDPRSFMKPDLSAPGVSILSLGRGDRGMKRKGTSMAAPHVTGVISLMLEANPTLEPRQIKEILEVTAKDLGPPGKDAEHGSGLVDAERAVRRALALREPANRSSTPEEALGEGREFLAANRVQLAIGRFISVIGRSRAAGPLAEEAMYLLGRCYFGQKNFKGAIETYSKLVELSPDSEWASRARYQIGRAELHSPVSEADGDTGRFRQALEAFRQFLAADPDHEWAPLALLEKSSAEEALGETAAAIASLDELLVRFPASPHGSEARQTRTRLAALPATPVVEVER